MWSGKGGVQWQNIQFCEHHISGCLGDVHSHGNATCLSELCKEAAVRTIFIAIKLVTIVRWKVVTFQLSQNVFLIIFYLVFFIESKKPNYSKLVSLSLIHTWIPGWSVQTVQWEPHNCASWRPARKSWLCNGSPILCDEQLLYKPGTGSDRTVDKVRAVWSWSSHAAQKGKEFIILHFESWLFIKY